MSVPLDCTVFACEGIYARPKAYNMGVRHDREEVINLQQQQPLALPSDVATCLSAEPRQRTLMEGRNDCREPLTLLNRVAVEPERHRPPRGDDGGWCLGATQLLGNSCETEGCFGVLCNTYWACVQIPRGVQPDRMPTRHTGMLCTTSRWASCTATRDTA